VAAWTSARANRPSDAPLWCHPISAAPGRGRGKSSGRGQAACGRPSSVDLLAYLGGRCPGWRLLLVLTYRPSDLLQSRHPFGPVKLDLQARGPCREVALPFLSRDDFDRWPAPAAAVSVVCAGWGSTPVRSWPWPPGS
jgi:hypothetical protein